MPRRSGAAALNQREPRIYVVQHGLGRASELDPSVRVVHYELGHVTAAPVDTVEDVVALGREEPGDVHAAQLNRITRGWRAVTDVRKGAAALAEKPLQASFFGLKIRPPGKPLFVDGNELRCLHRLRNLRDLYVFGKYLFQGVDECR